MASDSSLVSFDIADLNRALTVFPPSDLSSECAIESSLSASGSEAAAATLITVEATDDSGSCSTSGSATCSSSINVMIASSLFPSSPWAISTYVMCAPGLAPASTRDTSLISPFTTLSPRRTSPFA